MSAFFADTFYWIALTNKRDSAHRGVMEFTAALNPRTVISSDEVLTEFLTFCASDDLLRGVAGAAVNGVADVLTNDRHFEQEGFRPVFR